MEIDADTRNDAFQAGASEGDPNAAPKLIKAIIDGNFEGSADTYTEEKPNEKGDTDTNSTPAPTANQEKLWSFAKQHYHDKAEAVVAQALEVHELTLDDLNEDNAAMILKDMGGGA